MLKVGDTLKYVGPHPGYKIPLMTVTALSPEHRYGISVRYHEPMIMPDGHVETDDNWRYDLFELGDLILHHEIPQTLRRHSF